MKKIVTLITIFSALLILLAGSWSGQAASEKKIVNGAAIYSQNCVKCHGAAGKGVENFTPDLTKPMKQTGWLSIINKGKGAMPGFKDSLSAAQVSAVLRHVRSFAAKGGKKK